MKTFIHFKTLTIGLAMFSMFFGAGNVIFPLAIGHFAQDQTLYAILGLLITAVAVPFTGLIAMILFDGDQKRFFGAIGPIPGFLMAFTIITLLGPLGSTPRCIALSYSTIKISAGEIPPLLFNALACVIIYLFTYQKKRILDWLGYFLTPLLLGSLAYIIIKGLMTADVVAASTEQDHFAIFLHGLKEGYNTMDLLAAFFFSSIILSAIKETLSVYPQEGMLKIALRSSAIGAFLLAATYIGFSLIASYHSQDLAIAGMDQLLGAITMKIMGPSAGIWVCFTIAIACLTTAIALCNVFAEFAATQLFQNKISYHTSLIGTLLVTFVVANWEFEGISAFLGPILEICYPFLIALTAYNLYTVLLAKRKNKLVTSDS
jgi:branched-chain amino acid:cation transporter, LIVCS family